MPSSHPLDPGQSNPLGPGRGHPRKSLGRQRLGGLIDPIPTLVDLYTPLHKWTVDTSRVLCLPQRISIPLSANALLAVQYFQKLINKTVRAGTGSTRPIIYHAELDQRFKRHSDHTKIPLERTVRPFLVQAAHSHSRGYLFLSIW